jgi:hypothetical protein
VVPSFIFVIRASASTGLIHSLLEVFFFRFRSTRARSSRLGVAIPDPRCQLREELFVAGPVVPPHDGTHGRIGFQHGCIHAHGFAFQQAPIRQHAQNPQEHFAVRFHIDEPPGSGDGGVIRGSLVQTDPQKLTQAQRIGGPPRDPPFRVDAFKVPNQQQAEVRSRRQRRTSVPVRVEGGAFGFGKLVELLPIQQFVQPPIERMTGAGGQFRMADPQLLLPLPVLASAHRHKNILRPFCFTLQDNRPARLDFHHGLLGLR